MKYDQPELQEKLAAEYVLGTLLGSDRRRFARLLQSDTRLQAVVAAWEARLLPLIEGVKPVEPPARVWEQIAARTGVAMARKPVQARQQPRASFWDSLNFWRSFAISSSALAFGLFLYLATLGKPEPVLLPPAAPESVAVLAGKEAKPVMLVSAEPGTGTLTVTVLSKEPIAADRDFELWALPQGGAPKSLGVVAASGITRLKLPADGVTAPAMAISLEPKGGSPTGGPTGPVLYSGLVVKIGI